MTWSNFTMNHWRLPIRWKWSSVTSSLVMWRRCFTRSSRRVHSIVRRRVCLRIRTYTLTDTSNSIVMWATTCLVGRYRTTVRRRRRSHSVRVWRMLVTTTNNSWSKLTTTTNLISMIWVSIAVSQSRWLPQWRIYVISFHRLIDKCHLSAI